MLAIWSVSSAFSKSSLNIWKFLVHVLLKPGLANFEYYFDSMWDECNCAVVWEFIGIAFLWDWNEHWPFSVLWPLLSFPNLLSYWVQHFHNIIFQDFLQFVVIHIVKGFGIVNKAEIDVFLELPCFFYDQRMLALWSLVPLPFLKPAWTSGSSQFTYCWSLAWRILSITVLAYEMSAIVQ